jgi:hypothetical protein
MNHRINSPMKGPNYSLKIVRLIILVAILSVVSAARSSAQIAPSGGIFVQQSTGVYYVFGGDGTHSGGSFYYLNYSTHEFDVISPITIQTNGSFSGFSSVTGRSITGQISATSIALTYNGVTISSPKLPPFGPTKALSSGYIGTLVDNANNVSTVTLVIWPNGQVVGVQLSSFGANAGVGTIDASGNLWITLLSGEVVSTTASPHNGFVQGTMQSSFGSSYYYALDAVNPPRLANISTRGLVGAGEQVLIAGFIVKDGGKLVAIRALGPSLAAFGVPNPVQNPRIDLYMGNQLIVSNGDWKTNANAADITGAGFSPSDDREAVLYITLEPGAYTAIVSSEDTSQGVGLVEVYDD